MEISYLDKTAIVTGGASGMGAALVRLVLEAGGEVVIADLDEAGGSRLAAEYGKAARFIRADITDIGDCVRATELAMRAFGRINVLFNNAGKGGLGDVLATPHENWDRMIEINLSGAFRMTKAAIPLLKEAGGGAIVNTCSVSGIAGDYAMIAYNTAKAGLINFTRCLALDHASDNIRANAVCPGIIETAMTSELPKGPGGIPLWERKIPMRRLGRAVEVAQAMAFAGSDLASYMTGAVLVVDGGLLTHTGMPTPDDFAAAAAPI